MSAPLRVAPLRVALDRVSKGARGEALPATSVSFTTGRATLVRTETAQRPSVLGLIASGRMRPDTGTVTLDGRPDAAGLRRRIALVDAPAVCDPAPDVSVAGVVEEELMFAGITAGPRLVRSTIADLGVDVDPSMPIGVVAPSDRVRLLCGLAARRPGVDGLVLVSPDRHGGEPLGWWDVCRELAADGLAVLVIAGDASAAAIAAHDLLERLDSEPLDAAPIRETPLRETRTPIQTPTPTPTAEDPS